MCDASSSQLSIWKLSNNAALAACMYSTIAMPVTVLLAYTGYIFMAKVVLVWYNGVLIDT